MSESDRLHGWRIHGDNWGQSLSANTYPREEPRMSYTSEDFERVLTARDGGTFLHYDPECLAAALKIAALATKTGVVERACAKLAGLESEMIEIDDWRLEAGVIRSALGIETPPPVTIRAGSIRCEAGSNRGRTAADADRH